MQIITHTPLLFSAKWFPNICKPVQRGSWCRSPGTASSCIQWRSNCESTHRHTHTHAHTHTYTQIYTRTRTRAHTRTHIVTLPHMHISYFASTDWSSRSPCIWVNSHPLHGSAVAEFQKTAAEVSYKLDHHYSKAGPSTLKPHTFPSNIHSLTTSLSFSLSLSPYRVGRDALNYGETVEVAVSELLAYNNVQRFRSFLIKTSG